jgi:hypothetical protein
MFKTFVSVPSGHASYFVFSYQADSSSIWSDKNYCQNGDSSKLFRIVGKLYQTLYLQISSHERAHKTAMVNEPSVNARICRDIRRYAGRSFNLRSQHGFCRGTSVDKKSEAQLPRTPNASINLAPPSPGDSLGSNCNSLN